MSNREISKKLAAKLAASVDDHIYSAMGITNKVSGEPQDSFTIDKLRRMMIGFPAKETWLSSRIFPNDKAWVVKGTGENFTCAGSTFWLRLEHHIRSSEEVKPTFNPMPFGIKMTPIEIDAWSEDSPETAAWRRDHWRRLKEAVEIAMVPLPDWLRNAPEFTSFG